MRTWIAMIILVGSTLSPGQTTSPPSTPAEDYSGMYTFRQDGEFVQITIEDANRVTGFVSRFGDSEGDRGAFLNQFFKQGTFDGKKLTFTTSTVHGVWFDFKGVVDRGNGKTPSDEGYHLLKGTLTETHTGADKKVSAKSSDVVLKSFPQEAGPTPSAHE